jgi:hypothetical protein
MALLWHSQVVEALSPFEDLSASRAGLRAAPPRIGIRNQRADWRFHPVLTEERLRELDDMPMIDPPIRLASNPQEVIDSTEGAASFMERRDGDAFDIEAAVVIRLLRKASTPQAVVTASEAFRDWADGLGFLDDPAPDAEL